MEKQNMSINEATEQQVYIIQLDHDVQFDSQAIPLHILENDLNGDLILPLLQQKHGQPLQLFVETPNEVTNVVKNDCKTEVQNAITSIQVNPVDMMNIVEQKLFYDDIHNELHNQHIKVPSIPISVKIEPICDDEVKVTTKQKIKNYVHISDSKAPPRAVAVLPSALHFRGKLILPRRTLSSRIRFGPVQGIRNIISKSEADKLVYNATSPVFLLNRDERHVIHIDVTDKDKSNWLGLLPLGKEAFLTTPATANLWLYEDNNELYVLTVHPITARTPLKLGYSKKYTEDHNIPHGQPVLDLETANSVQWWCNECNRALQSAALLQRHTDVYHKDTLRAGWSSSYRCKYCKRTFGRLFTLKRHMTCHCTKRPKKLTEDNQQPTEAIETNPEPEIESALEDNRIPSDESFQNFTNSLDFSTNLFDTDRIAGLDISGNSRADSETNPYSISFRDDNDLGFTKVTTVTEPVQNENNQENNTPLVYTCSYCNQVVARQSKNKHLRQCPSRLICECGRVFRHKKSLAKHIHQSHPYQQSEKVDENAPEEDQEMAYKCQECPTRFKRRGMLVNHLWRIHKAISTMPVEKKVKHYPCVACPRIYCSSSKRNKHVRMHHPDAEKVRGHSVEGGVKSCQAASCPECPRQYATRAKLLQHMRAQHPHSAVPFVNKRWK